MYWEWAVEGIMAEQDHLLISKFYLKPTRMFVLAINEAVRIGCSKQNKFLFAMNAIGRTAVINNNSTIKYPLGQKPI